MTAFAKAPILVAGATASGKSTLALAIAARTNGVVINADSMQVYRDLPIITAQPSAAEQAAAPHRLYGHVPASEAYSTGKYLADIALALNDARAAGLRPIIVGGTGLYFKALLTGLSPAPPIPGDVRAFWRQRAADVGAEALHRELAARDKVMAARLNPADTQRITRALEVIEASGVSLATWQEQAGQPLIDDAIVLKLVVMRTREDLYTRCDTRFDQMLAHGALEEVAALAAQGLARDLPAMRALGVPSLLAHLAGCRSLDAAAAAAKLETRQYVKRQQTWLKRNMMSWTSVNTQQMENIDALAALIV